MSGSRLLADTDDEESLLDLSQCSEFDDNDSLSASVFELLDTESLEGDQEDMASPLPPPTKKTASHVLRQSAASAVPRVPIEPPQRPVPGPRLATTATDDMSHATNKPANQRTRITAPKEHVMLSITPVSAPSSVAKETKDPHLVSPKSTIINLKDNTSFYYVPEELPCVEVPERARKKTWQTSPRKRAHTISGHEGPTLLLETKRAKTDDPDLRNVITTSRMNKQRSVSMDASITQSSQTSSPQQSSIKSTRHITYDLPQSSLSRTVSHSITESRTPNQSSSSLSRQKLTSINRSIFASRPNIASYCSSGIGGFSLKHLGQRVPETNFSLNHL